jgi:carbon-monoxide dehydrogenase small subunit
VVLIDGEPVKSCTALAVMAEGREIRTVESLEVDGRLDPVQMGFHERHALQCGFCTPGMLMAAAALLSAGRPASREEIRAALHGNLCRCTGYGPIVDAVEAAQQGQRR